MQVYRFNCRMKEEIRNPQRVTLEEREAGLHKGSVLHVAPGHTEPIKAGVL